MALKPGTIYTPSTAAQVRDDFLTDVRLEARKYADDPDEVDRAVRPGTDLHILGTALGNLAILQYSNISIADKQTDVLSAVGVELDRKREAYGLPEVPASPSTGRIVPVIQSAVANFSNHQFVLPNGKRGQVDGVFAGVANGFELPVFCIDAGADTNLSSGTVRFVNPPLGVETEAAVSTNAPLVGGTDEEDDERKRQRILNRLQTVPAGGNVGYIIETALNALATVQAVFVYPALGGPGSAKVVLVKDINPDVYDFARSLSAAAQDIVRNALLAAMPSPMEIVVGTVAAGNTDVAITVQLPAAASQGGNGQGWLDDAPWPPLAGGDTKVAITAVSGWSVTVNATTAVSPVAGQTHIAWWSSVDQKFQTRLVTGVSGGSGAWVLVVDQPLTDHNNAAAAVGDYISPAAVYTEAYGTTWRDVMRQLGPGENTSDVNRLPRALRHPYIEEAWPSDLTVLQLTSLVTAHPEIQDASWSYRSASAPAVPGSVATAPNILVPRHFGVYKA